MTPNPTTEPATGTGERDGFTSPGDFYESLTHDAQDFLQCRGYGHSWEPHTVITRGSKRNPSYEVTVVCGSCQALRTDYLDRFGDPVRHSYLQYPTGYVADGSGGAMRGTRGLAKLVGVTKTSRFTILAPEDERDA